MLGATSHWAEPLQKLLEQHGGGRLILRIGSLRCLATTLLVFCLYACPRDPSAWLIRGCAVIGAAETARSSLADEMETHAGHLREETDDSIPAPAAEKAQAEDLQNDDRQNAVTANIWEELEAAKRTLHEAHRNPKVVKLMEGVKRAVNVTSTDVRQRSSIGKPLLVVFTKADCPYSQEALSEAELAQPMIRSFGGSTIVATVDTEKEPTLAKNLGLRKAPAVHFYRDGNMESPEYRTYNGTDIVASEIAHWALTQEEATTRYATEGEQPIRLAADLGSPVGPVVRATVHRGSQLADMVESISRSTDLLPSRFTLFDIHFVGASQSEELRVYRKQLPFDVGEEEFLTLKERTSDPGAIIALLQEAENRKIFFGNEPSLALQDSRALFSVYVSRYENLQDIAWLLMEFLPKYEDRVAFHVAYTTLKSAARSKGIFGHTWGGAILTDQRGNASAYQRVAGVMREAIPFDQYSLSMPFNYHSMKAFFEEWESGKRELHFRSNPFSYSEKGSHVKELSHLQFLKILKAPGRAPMGILYYESGNSDCKAFLHAWRMAAQFFAENEAVQGRILFGQVDGLLNDILDFDMRSKIPVIAVYSPGLRALDARAVYTGPPVAELIVGFLERLLLNNDEL